MNGRAEMVGTVTDPSGAVVPGADVQLRSVASGKIRPATTDASGRFTFSGLPKGDYVIQVTQQGFKAAAQTLTLEVRDRAVLSAVLSVGQVTDAVEVEAGGMVVQTAKGQTAGVPGRLSGGAFGPPGGLG